MIRGRDGFANGISERPATAVVPGGYGLANGTQTGTTLDLLRTMVSAALVASLVTILLGTSIFSIADRGGGIVGVLLGYFGEALRRFSMYFWLPLCVAAWLLGKRESTHTRGFANSALIPFIFFLVYAVVHVMTSEPAVQKNRIEMFASVAPVLILILPLNNPRGHKLFWFGMLLAGFTILATLMGSGQLASILRGEGVIGLTRETSSRLTLGKDTITTASIVYQCALAGVLWLFAYRHGFLRNAAIAITCTLLVVIGLLTGSKGPLVSLAVALSTVFVIARIRASHLLIVAIIVSVVILFGLPIVENYTGAGKHLALGASDKARIQYYGYVIGSVPTLFGNGVGSFAMRLGLPIAEGGYVHNAVLEAYYEMGVIGVGLFVWSLGTIGWRLLRTATHNPVGSFLLAYFVYTLSLSMFTGSIFGAKELLLAMTLGCAKFGLSEGLTGVQRRQVVSSEAG